MSLQGLHVLLGNFLTNFVTFGFPIKGLYHPTLTSKECKFYCQAKLSSRQEKMFIHIHESTRYINKPETLSL